MWEKKSVDRVSMTGSGPDARITCAKQSIWLEISQLVEGDSSSLLAVTFKVLHCKVYIASSPTLQQLL